MPYDKQTLADAKRALEAERVERSLEFAQRRKEVFAQIPRLRAIDRQLSSTAFRVLRECMATGTDPQAGIASLREENLALQEERAKLLMQFGYAADYLDETPLCAVCDDSGYAADGLCACVKKRYAKLLTKRLSTVLPIEVENFSTFQLDYYSKTPDARLGVSPYEIMTVTLNECKRFASTFVPKQSDNLLLFGSTGLGKTFLSSCIAAEVAEKGFSVAYDTAINIVTAYETLKFGNGDGAAAAEKTAQYERADLLIIDDMGTEMGTAFTVSALYNLINTRLMSHGSMIINTNLAPEQFEQKYSPAVASRLLGEFYMMRFVGEDIRRKKRSAHT